MFWLKQTQLDVSPWSNRRYDAAQAIDTYPEDVVALHTDVKRKGFPVSETSEAGKTIVRRSIEF